VGALDVQEIPAFHDRVGPARHIFENREQEPPVRQLAPLLESGHEPIGPGVPALAGVRQHTDRALLVRGP
jgi:hypothetical protein